MWRSGSTSPRRAGLAPCRRCLLGRAWTAAARKISRWLAQHHARDPRESGGFRGIQRTGGRACFRGTRESSGRGGAHAGERVDGAALAAFIWAARDDQFEDLDTPPKRAIFDDMEVNDGAACVTHVEKKRKNKGKTLDTR